MILDKDYPVEMHPTWDVHDPSKVQEFISCPRKYFYRYVLGWEREGSNFHLVFGEAVHRAMAHLLETDYSPENVTKAYKKFHSFYREHFSMEQDDIFAPKSPDHFLPALVKYTNHWRETDKNFDVLRVEEAGSVIVNREGTHKLHFRIDSILEDETGIRSREHKTGSYISEAWLNQWGTKCQVSTYTHVLNCEFDPEKIWGIEINGIIAQKGLVRDRKMAEKEGLLFSGYQFERVPVRKSLPMMNTWLWEINYWLDQIQWNYDQLAKSSPTGPYMAAFPCNTESCTKYNRACEYLPYCTVWPNPLKKCLNGPHPGFTTTWWDPRDYRDEAGSVVDITKMVEEKE